jgi:hypothetical protein
MAGLSSAHRRGRERFDGEGRYKDGIGFFGRVTGRAHASTVNKYKYTVAAPLSLLLTISASPQRAQSSPLL